MDPSTNTDTKPELDEDLVEKQEAEKRRLALKADMAKNYKKNCDGFFDEVNKFIKNNKPLHKPSENCFYIGPLDFNDGSDDSNELNLGKVMLETVKRGEERAAKNAKALENAAKSGKTIPLGELTVFNKVNVVVHSFDIDGVYVFLQSNPDSPTFVQDMIRFIGEKLKYQLWTDFTGTDSCKVFFLPTDNCPTKSPMNDRDVIHKTAFSYFIETGVIKRNDEEEELVMGDDFFDTL